MTQCAETSKSLARPPTGFRNILIHAYDRVAAEILVGVVQPDIPPLLVSVRGLLGGDQNDSQPTSNRTE